MYIIGNIYTTKLFWSSKLGWIEDGEEIDIFSDEETEFLNLPMEGKWIKLNTPTDTI